MSIDDYYTISREDLERKQDELNAKLEAVVNRMNSQLLLRHWRPKRIHYSQVRDELRDLIK